MSEASSSIFLCFPLQAVAESIAQALCERAHTYARMPTRRTPWSVSASSQTNFPWARFFLKGGGKMDDCTVLVAFVTE